MILLCPAKLQMSGPLCPKAVCHLNSSRRILWNSKIAQSPPSVRYDSLLPSAVGEDLAERGVLRWLDKVVSQNVIWTG